MIFRKGNDMEELMSNSEIIEWLKKKAETVPMPGARKMYEAAAKALEAQKDMISRQAVMDAINRIECTKYTTWYEFYQKVITAVGKLPPAEPKRGKWIYCEDSMADCVDGYRCDQCGFFVPWDYKHKGIDFIQDYNFCPNCGADMREVTT